VKIQYKRFETANATTWFAVMRKKDTDLVRQQLERWQCQISEASVQGTDIDQELWAVATTPDKEIWHRAQQHRNQPNTMISVLAGAIDKLRGGGDLTAKQLGHVIKISEIMKYFNANDSQVTFEQVDQFALSGNAVQDLQDRLFSNA